MVDLALLAFRNRLRDALDAWAVADELLAALRERMAPAFVVLWTEGGAELSLPPFTVDDPLVGYALRHPAPASIEGIALASPALDGLRAAGVVAIAPLVSLGG